ncbi:MAG TPA: ABC transporter permease [Thermoanaerobaculia bacterium]
MPSEKTKSPAAGRIALSLSGLALLLAAWALAIRLSPNTLLPGPLAASRAIVEIAQKGFLVKHVVASLFRVTWGYLLAVTLGVPLGMLLGRFRRPEMAIAPLIEFLRPISPLAWIPIAILWFGVGDLAAVFIIFLASLLPITLTAMNAVGSVATVHWNAGLNFGLSPSELAKKVIAPAILPQLIVGLRLTLGIAWLVVVAAEMIAVNSGLGFLIIDARNAGNRYDVVVAGMVLIGLIGVGLDAAMRRLERLKAASWGYESVTDGIAA